MSKREFKVGDRVAVYQSGVRETGIIGSSQSRDNTLIVVLDDTSYPSPTIAHFKQLRHLKKKERRRVWVFFPHNSSRPFVTDTKEECIQRYGADIQNEFIEFIEVRKK